MQKKPCRNAMKLEDVSLLQSAKETEREEHRKMLRQQQRQRRKDRDSVLLTGPDVALIVLVL